MGNENRTVADLLGWDPDTGERGPVLYSSFEELKTDIVWGKYVVDPEEKWTKQVDDGEISEELKAEWKKARETELAHIRSQMVLSTEITVNFRQSNEYLSPEVSMHVFNKNKPIATVTVGAIIQAVRLTHEQTLDMANSKAWGD